MGIRNKYRVSPEIDMGPFADIAFLLIIFFILTTSFMRPMGQLLDLPATSKEESKQEAKHLTVTMTPGSLLFGKDEDSQKQITADALRLQLFALDLPSQEGQGRIVVVNLADGVPYGQFFGVVTTISKAGGVVTLIEEEEEDAVEAGS